MKIKVSNPEFYLLETIRKVEYGTLYGVEIREEREFIECDVSPAAMALLEYIRSGTRYIDVLTIHAGQPVSAETDCVINGFRCRAKTKFPTG